MLETFAKRTGNIPLLRNIKLAMDHGYWLAHLLFRLLDLGAEVHGTIKRMDFVPLTFENKKKANDSKRPLFPIKPTVIECGG